MKATYANIQKYVKNKYNRRVKTCWIADVKRVHGLTTRTASNRLSSNKVQYPCPEDRRQEIEDSLKHFEML